MFFFKIHPACHSDANEIKPGSNQKMTDKHAAEYSKAVFWDVINVCEMQKLFIQQNSQKYRSP